MSATIYDSKPLVAQMTAELQSEAAQFRKHRHRPARLAQIVVGHDAAAEVYSRQLVRACRTIGLGCVTLAFCGGFSLASSPPPPMSSSQSYKTQVFQSQVATPWLWDAVTLEASQQRLF